MLKKLLTRRLWYDKCLKRWTLFRLRPGVRSWSKVFRNSAFRRWNRPFEGFGGIVVLIPIILEETCKKSSQCVAFLLRWKSFLNLTYRIQFFRCLQKLEMLQAFEVVHLVNSGVLGEVSFGVSLLTTNTCTTTKAKWQISVAMARWTWLVGLRGGFIRDGLGDGRLKGPPEVEQQWPLKSYRAPKEK